MWQVSLFIFHKEDLSYGSQGSAQWKYVGIVKLSLKKTRLPNLTPQYPGVHVPILEKVTSFDFLSHFFRFWLGDKHIHRHRHFILRGKYA